MPLDEASTTWTWKSSPEQGSWVPPPPPLPVMEQGNVASGKGPSMVEAGYGQGACGYRALGPLGPHRTVGLIRMAFAGRHCY